ncbi:MAG TPA: acylphosphatase [Nitrospirales bacterium]|jgi:acylphosphatase|nr:acylphosphatase [Nitrospirales bacterium]
MAPSSPDQHDLVAVEVVVSGDVQGVGYRAFAQRAAKDLGLSGWVRNLYDGRVQVEVEGPRAKVEELLARLRHGPSLAVVTDVSITWKTPTGSTQGFTIRL